MQMALICYVWVTVIKLKKLGNALKHLVSWLNTYKISLNIKKTELVVFRSMQKKFECDLKVRTCGKKTTSHRRYQIPGGQSWCKA